MKWLRQWSRASKERRDRFHSGAASMRRRVAWVVSRSEMVPQARWALRREQEVKAVSGLDISRA